MKRLSKPDRYVYTENVSKTNSGTFKKLRVPNKVVPVYACPEAGERCAVFLLDLYISKLPPEAFTKDIFYARPLDNTPTDPPDLGIQHLQLERTFFRKNSPVIAVKQVLKGILPTMVCVLPQPHRCTGVVFLRRLSRSALVMDHWRLCECMRDRTVSNISQHAAH